jgi:hypothetical protein
MHLESPRFRAPRTAVSAFRQFRPPLDARIAMNLNKS